MRFVLAALLLVVEDVGVFNRIVPIFKLLQSSTIEAAYEKRRLTKAEIIRNIYLCIGPVLTS